MSFLAKTNVHCSILPLSLKIINQIPDLNYKSVRMYLPWYLLSKASHRIGPTKNSFFLLFFSRFAWPNSNVICVFVPKLGHLIWIIRSRSSSTYVHYWLRKVGTDHSVFFTKNREILNFTYSLILLTYTQEVVEV